MVSLIVGNKGCGKTKKLIELVEKAVSKSNGNVVVIEKGNKLTYDITHKARLIDVEQYNISGFDSLYGFVCGICAGNYDVTDILIDSTLKIGGRDLNKLSDFLNQVKDVSEKSNAKFIVLVSADKSELSDNLDKDIEII